MPGLREVIFEFYRVGAYVKVSAVDPETCIEVQIMGPANAGREPLERVALRKLRRAIENQRRTPSAL
jgi:hypothetical protein